MLTTADDSCRLSSLTNRRNTYSLLRMPDSLHLASQLSPFHPPKQAYCSKYEADFMDKQYCAEQCSRKEGPKGSVEQLDGGNDAEAGARSASV